jgi:excisionase family DNA binding protein
VGRKATGSVQRVSRVAKETENRVGTTGLSAKHREARFFCHHENQNRRKPMLKEKPEVLTTREACQYLRISRPTFLKLIYTNEIRAKKVGRGWKVLKSELKAYLNKAPE